MFSQFPFGLKLFNRVITITFPERVNLIMFNKLSTAKQKQMNLDREMLIRKTTAMERMIRS